MPLFLGRSFRATIFFVSVFSIHRCLFLGRFYQYLHIFFAVYYAYFIKKSNSVLSTKFS